MQVIHSIYRPQPRVVKVKRLTPDEERAELRLQRKMQSDLETALNEYSSEVAEIREYQPGWMPGQQIK